MTDEDQEMYKIMGFVNFDTTKVCSRKLFFKISSKGISECVKIYGRREWVDFIEEFLTCIW